MLKKLLILIPVLLIFLLAMAFGAQNPQTVIVNLLVLQTEMAVASLLAIFFGSGFVVGILLLFLSSLSWRYRYNRLLRRVSKLDKES
ncbi:MAG: lipopolysaccharide assembly protein LapA domain-containing protein [Pseudomonadota bacterium]